MTRGRLVVMAAIAVWHARRWRRRGPATDREPATSASRRASSRRARSTPSPTSPASRVGHVTLRRRRPRPHRRHRGRARTAAMSSRTRSPAAVFVGNAFGKLAGSTQVEELGTIETPIVLTNTLGVGAAVEGVVQWTLAQAGQRRRALGQRAGRRDQRRRPERHPRPARAAGARRRGDPRRPRRAPSRRAASAPAPARAPSAGRAASAPSSRRLPARLGGYTVGVLVQTQLRRRADDGRRAGRHASWAATHYGAVSAGAGRPATAPA